MKLTIFGLTLTSSWGNGHATPYRAILKALARRGHRITFFEKDLEFYRLRRDFCACDYCDVRLYESWDAVRAQARSCVLESDVVMHASYCPEGARIIDQTLELPGPLRVFYDLDTPVTLRNLQAGDVDYLKREQIPRFDLYLSWTGGDSLRRLEADWDARMARPLYGCVDPGCYFPVPVREQYRCDLSYMGTYAPDRQEKLDLLFLEPSRRKRDRRFVLAGSLYPWQWQWGENVVRFDHVAPADHPAFYSSSNATLNLTREDMARVGYCPSPRLFEAAACGSIIVSDTWPGLGMFFTAGEELLPVTKAEDVLRALELGHAERSKIALRARERTLDENTGEHRADYFLKCIEEASGRTEIRTAAPEAA